MKALMSRGPGRLSWEETPDPVNTERAEEYRGWEETLT